MSRIKAIAVRCQLLVGSFDGAQRVCPCPCPDACKLTEEQRKEYESHPDVVAAKEANQAEYEALQVQAELCTCPCHTTPGVIHMFPCCEVCVYCGAHVKFEYANAHVSRCMDNLPKVVAENRGE